MFKGSSETTQARSRSRHVITSARPLPELYAHGITAKNRLWGRLLRWITRKRGTRMVESMRPDPAETEAVQCSRFRQLSRLTHVYHAQPARHAQPTHRWLAMKSQSDSTWYTRLCGAAAVAQLRTRPPSSAHTQGDSDHRDELQKEAILCCNRDRIAQLARYRHICHRRRLSRRNPAAASCAHASPV